MVLECVGLSMLHDPKTLAPIPQPEDEAPNEEIQPDEDADDALWNGLARA